MTNRPTLLFFLLAFTLTTATFAAPVKIVGLDDMSCRNWINGKNDSDLRKNQLAWVRGTLSGHNYANQKQQVSNISNGTVENFVDRYCYDNPQGEFSDAALRMADKFSGRNESISK
ncbi:MAG: hypothetical protein WCL27_02890 [Betaproteobacteria bacterium]